MPQHGSSLLWRCRRGIREMDLLLQRFVEIHFDALTAEEINTFEQLLEYPDLDIMDWIMERKTPPNDSIKLLVQQIRNTDNPKSNS